MIRSYSTQALVSLCAVAAAAMDSAWVRSFRMVWDHLPEGPALNFARSRFAVHMANDDISYEAAYRQSLQDLDEHPQHGPVARDAAMRALVDCAAPLPADHPLAHLQTPCGQCGTTMQTLHFYNGNRYCSEECCHKAGDRSRCRIGSNCGCTPWAIKRRQLRKSRVAMRVMRQVISDYALQGVLERRLALEGDLAIAADYTMDEDSDAEDPMVTQVNDISNLDNIVQLSRNMVELAETRRGLKRGRGSD